MKKYLLTLLLLFSFATSISYGDTVSFYEEYGVRSEVNYLNLNGNLRNLINWANGNISNVNLKDGFRMVEILGSLPIAEVPGRVVYLTTEDLLYIDDGSNWWGSATYQGTPAQGELLWFDGTNWVRLGVGSVGNTLKTGGAAADISWASLNLAGGANYVTGTLPEANGGTGVTSGVMIDGDAAGGFLGGTYPDPTIGPASLKQLLYFHGEDYYSQQEVFAFGMGLAMFLDDKDESYLQAAITWGSLAEADLVAGLVSRQCLYFDGGADYAAIADDARHDPGTALTIEVWAYRVAGGPHYIFSDDGVGANIWLGFTNTAITGYIITTAGNEIISATHSLPSNGTGAWYHIVLVWDSSSAADVYINGVNFNGGNSGGNGAVLALTGLVVGADANYANKFIGKIDGLRMLKRKMSATEILARYEAFK